MRRRNGSACGRAQRRSRACWGGGRRRRPIHVRGRRAQVLARVFITPMPVLRLLERLGASRELRVLREAVATMRASLLAVIHVRGLRRAARVQGGRRSSYGGGSL